MWSVGRKKVARHQCPKDNNILPSDSLSAIMRFIGYADLALVEEMWVFKLSGAKHHGKHR